MAMTVESSEKKYPSGGCKFVQEVVNYTMGKLPEARHITALELLENCRQYAIEQYGFLYRNVLENWHIHSGEDIGNIVYELIDARIPYSSKNPMITSILKNKPHIIILTKRESVG